MVQTWVQVVTRTDFVPGGRAHTCAVLEDSLRRLVAALIAEPFDATRAYQVGRDLVAAQIASPRALGGSITLFSHQLLAELDISDQRAPARLAELMGHLITGFTEAMRNVALTAAEDLSRAERVAWRDKQRDLNHRLQDALLHDRLTGLPNRAHLAQWLDEILADPPADARLGVCLINLDRFKAVNDSLGPDKGDQLLLAVACRLSGQASRFGHFLAHLGGDEFVFVVEGTTNSDDVVKVADLALRTLSAPFSLDDHQIPISASAGIVERAAVGAQPNELLRSADITVGWAKDDHGGQWAIFDPARTAAEMRRHTLTAAMPAALARGEFTLAYQPLVRLADHAMIGVEALARWCHPEFGTISPDQFIPLAEHTGFIVPLGLSLLEQACTQAALWWQCDRSSPMVSVNLAAAQIRYPGLPAVVAGVLDRTGWPADQLQLEITESAIFDTDQTALDNLYMLAQQGIRLAIDDFGTGYSGLAYLANLPVHGIKLARDFLCGLETPGLEMPGPDTAASVHRSNSTILPALISLGHDLALTVTAEGIETAAQARHLATLGCDLGQGFYLGRPTTADHITRLLSQ